MKCTAFHFSVEATFSIDFCNGLSESRAAAGVTGLLVLRTVTVTLHMTLAAARGTQAATGPFA